MVVGGTARMRLAALAVVCTLLVTSFPLALATNEVTMLGESAAAVAEEEGKPGGVSMPRITGGQYEQWAQEDQRVLSQFPPPPPEPKNRKQKAETLRWALMRGLKQDLVDAKEEKNKHTMRRQKGEREESDRNTMQSYIQQAQLKAKMETQLKLAKSNKQPAASEETPEQVDQAREDKAKAAAEEDTALEEAEMPPDEDLAQKMLEERSSALLQVSASPATPRERAIVDKAAKGGHLPATTEVCKIARKGLQNICSSLGQDSAKCAGGQKTYSQKCRHPDDTKDALEKASIHVKDGSSLHKAATETQSATLPADGTIVHVKAGSSLHNEATATVHVKEGSSLHNEAAATVHVKEGSSLHKAMPESAPASSDDPSSDVSAKASTVKSPEARASASGASASDDSKSQQSETSKKNGKYLAKKDQILHRNDASFTGEEVPAALKKESEAEINQVAEAAAKDFNNLESYKKSIVDAAVAAAAPVVAELKHKAAIKAKLAARSEQARAETAVQDAKKEESKQQAKEEQAKEVAQANKAVSKAGDKAAQEAQQPQK